jgi:hypothetical protein
VDVVEEKNDAREEGDQKDREEGDQEDREEDDEKDDENEKQLNTQWVDMHNQLGVAQGYVALDNKTTECVNMITKSNPNSEYNEVNVMKERVRDTYEKAEKRDVMGNSNPNIKYNEVNLIKLRVGDMHNKPEERDMMGNIDPKYSYNEVNMRKEKVGDMHEKLNKSKSKRDEFKVSEEMKDGNKEYEAGVKAHQGRKHKMHEKPETRYVMSKTNPDGKHEKVNVVRERGNMRQGQAEQLLKVLGYKFIADEQDLQHFPQEDRFDGDTVRHGDDHDVINSDNKKPMGEPVINNQHPKNWRLKELMLMLLLLKVGVVMKKDNSREIMDAVMLNTEYEAQRRLC